MRDRKYYYISNIKNVESIQENGITADADGNIQILTIDKGKIRDILNIAAYISSNQLFLDEYGLFEIIENGITGEFIDPNVTGKTAQYQNMLKQQSIGKEYIKFVNTYKTYFSI